jgi:hypothetical protein
MDIMNEILGCLGERRCPGAKSAGEVGYPPRVSREGKADPLEAGRGKDSPPASLERVTSEALKRRDSGVYRDETLETPQSVSPSRDWNSDNVTIILYPCVSLSLPPGRSPDRSHLLEVPLRFLPAAFSPLRGAYRFGKDVLFALSPVGFGIRLHKPYLPFYNVGENNVFVSQRCPRNP